MLAADGYVFSSDGFGEQPWPPDTVTHWFKRVRVAAGVDCTLRSLRHYNATQMLAAGIDLRTAAGRLGHAAGGAVTLKVYAHRTRLPTSAPLNCWPPSCERNVPAMSERRVGRAAVIAAADARGCPGHVSVERSARRVRPCAVTVVEDEVR
jgi:hypothetical protein